jgi:poly-gamma-glutamate synthesis protein (capsule biosynthesis protein)
VEHILTRPASPQPPGASYTPAQGLRLSFTGDVCLGRGVLSSHASGNVATLFDKVRGLFENSDLVVGNLEFAISPAPLWRYARRGVIAVEEHRLVGLGKAPFHVFSLANNHVMDAGTAGLHATLQLLRREGVRWLGAGATCEDALRPLVLHLKGRRIGLLSACDWSPHFAREHSPGIAPLRVRELERRVSALRAQCDLVVVLLHADLEFTSHPAPWRVRLARGLVDQGAHAVIQHHPHVIQGWERYGGGVIAYSLGNFLFRIQGNGYQEGHPGTLDGLVLHLQVEFGEHITSAWLVPTFSPVRIGSDHLPCLPPEPGGQLILAHLEHLSKQLREPRYVRSAWRRRAAEETRRLAYGMYVDASQGRLRRALLAPVRALSHPEDRRWLWGWVTAGYR